MKANSFRWAPLLLAACSLQGPLTAGIVFESAVPPLGNNGGVIANSFFLQQAIGVRFHISQTTHISALGVYASQNPSPLFSSLFGIIFALDDLSSYPSSDPYSGNGLATAYFDISAPDGARDRLAPLSFTFVPGDYAVVVASSGPDQWTINDGGVNSPGITYSSYIGYIGGEFAPIPQWQLGLNGVRIFMEGEVETPVPEPSSLALIGSALVLIALRSRFVQKCC